MVVVDLRDLKIGYKAFRISAGVWKGSRCPGVKLPRTLQTCPSAVVAITVGKVSLCRAPCRRCAPEWISASLEDVRLLSNLSHAKQLQALRILLCGRALLKCSAGLGPAPSCDMPFAGTHAQLLGSRNCGLRYLEPHLLPYGICHQHMRWLRH